MLRDVLNISNAFAMEGLTLLFVIIFEMSTSIFGAIAGEGKGGLE
jgi:hypothetical protein